MGYRRSPKAYRLKFEDPDLAGLEVTARSLPLGDFLKVAELAGTGAGNGMKSAGQLFAAFASALVEWNLEDDDGQPVPATLEGVHSQELDFMMTVVMAWIQAMSAVDTPLPGGSPNGVPSALAPSLPMEPRSPNPPS